MPTWNTVTGQYPGTQSVTMAKKKSAAKPTRIFSNMKTEAASANRYPTTPLAAG
jgi:hypothetical protein